MFPHVSTCFYHPKILEATFSTKWQWIPFVSPGPGLERCTPGALEVHCWLHDWRKTPADPNDHLQALQAVGRRCVAWDPNGIPTQIVLIWWYLAIHWTWQWEIPIFEWGNNRNLSINGGCPFKCYRKEERKTCSHCWKKTASSFQKFIERITQNHKFHVENEWKICFESLDFVVFPTCLNKFCSKKKRPVFLDLVPFPK